MANNYELCYGEGKIKRVNSLAHLRTCGITWREMKTALVFMGRGSGGTFEVTTQRIWDALLETSAGVASHQLVENMPTSTSYKSALELGSLKQNIMLNNAHPSATPESRRVSDTSRLFNDP